MLPISPPHISKAFIFNNVLTLSSYIDLIICNFRVSNYTQRPSACLRDLEYIRAAAHNKCANKSQHKLPDIFNRITDVK